MSSINTAAISGRLTRDPELRSTPSGTSVANIGVAVSRSRKDPAGDGWIEETSFIDCVAWSGLAELVARKFRKGDQITVAGRLNQSSWEQDGQKRSKVEIVVNEVDGPAMYRKDDEVPAREDGGAATTTTSSSAAAAGGSDDDIPF